MNSRATQHRCAIRPQTALLLLGFLACSGADPGPRFVDVAAESGITVETASGNPRKEHLLEVIGSGIAVADYDGDGDEDVYVATAQTTDDWLAGVRPRANALYRNDGDGHYTDVAEIAGVALQAWCSGVYFVDYDNDGDKDLFVSTWGPNVLYRNEGDGTFVDVTAAAGVAGEPGWWSNSAAFADLDLDGDLDFYVTNYLEYDLADPPLGGHKMVWKRIAVFRGPHGFVGQPDVLYRNDGDGTFTDVSADAGFRDQQRYLYGLAVVISDFDDDGDADIYVANDSHANRFYRNDGDLRFTEVSAMSGVATNEDAAEQAGMGADAGDYDGDGKMDIVVTNFSHDWNTLYRNLGELQFRDDTFRAGFRDSYTRLVWGTKFFDYDNDGWLDVFMSNGHIYAEVDVNTHLGTSYRQQNSLYRNNGDGTFENTSDTTGQGMALVENTRGLALADFNRDGTLDLFLSNLDGAPNLLRNDGDSNGWIRFLLEGTTTNRDAVGARLTVEAGGRTRIAEVNPFGSFLSQGTYEVHFGLGELAGIDSLTIRWPGGKSEQIGSLAGRRFYRITEGAGVTATAEPSTP